MSMSPFIVSYMPIGVYENGFFSLSGIVLFDNVYDMVEKRIKHKNNTNVGIIGKNILFKKVFYFYINNDKLKKIRKIVNDKGKADV